MVRHDSPSECEIPLEAKVSKQIILVTATWGALITELGRRFKGGLIGIILHLATFIKRSIASQLLNSMPHLR